MIAAGTWELFGDAIVVGALLAALLPLLGVLLVLRHQMFLAASIGQAATLGIAFAWCIGGGDGHGDTSVAALAAGQSLAMATAIAAMRALSVRDAAFEARAAWTFLFAGSASMLLLANAPHGAHGVQRLVLSSVLGASRTDVVGAAVLLAIVVVALSWRGRGLLAWAIDPPFAQVVGTPVLAYDLVVGAFVGFAIGFAIQATGLAFTFGATVLPVLAARVLAASLASLLWLAPAVGVAAFGGGFWFGDRADVPPGQSAVVVAAVAVPLAVAIRRVRSGRAPSPSRPSARPAP
ncbi:MAG: metal ABC transporter permease [Planctomycetes bacterium]|nr:metal ABC transporter permease [Planctomycetota bacterium]